jgi:predicted RNA-binding Zn-ribbon protein involved in translation (DUF1610 family)
MSYGKSYTVRLSGFDGETIIYPVCAKDEAEAIVFALDVYQDAEVLSVTRDRIELICPHCGSADLVRDAAARWCAENGEWELSSTYDNITCGDCGEETYDPDEVNLSRLPEEAGDEWMALVREAIAAAVLDRSDAQRYLVWWAKEEGLLESLKPEWVTPCPY